MNRIELENRVKELEAQLEWLDNHSTYCWHGQKPALLEVSKIIWYHATDDTNSCPFSDVIKKGYKNEQSSDN